ncbi:methylmalonyl-CoA mutase family protein [Streptomyces sp. NPDC015171]|uniref:methylmalonyl-CoA mutase family protein n=1 Tax=Streptomyces sp. NPDC015171 TaxID=3364945 RepID=UPI0037015470
MPDGPRSPTTYTGLGTAKEANARYRELIAQGATALSVAFDLPTRLGHDSDAPLARGGVGRAGVAVDSLDDMRVLLDGIPLETVSTSLSANAPAAPLLLLYQLVAEERGVPAGRLAGAVHNDVLQEYIARGPCIFPPAPSLRLTADVFTYCKAELPRWNAIALSGRLLAEAGASPAQEMAFTLANGMEYVRTALAAGLDTDDFAPLLQQIAALRAAPRTDEVRAEAGELLRRVEELGGALAALADGFQRREMAGGVARAAGRSGPEGSRALSRADAAVEARQRERLAKLRAWRDQERVDAPVAALRRAASGRDNVLYPMKDALAAGATVGEICAVLRAAWGVHTAADRPPATRGTPMKVQVGEEGPAS